MKSERAMLKNDLTRYLLCLGQSETASLFDFLEDTRFWIKNAHGSSDKCMDRRQVTGGLTIYRRGKLYIAALVL